MLLLEEVSLVQVTSVQDDITLEDGIGIQSGAGRPYNTGQCFRHDINVCSYLSYLPCTISLFKYHWVLAIIFLKQCWYFF